MIKTRKEIYLKSAEYFAIRNDTGLQYHNNGICFDLANRGMGGYGLGVGLECPEICLFTRKYEYNRNKHQESSMDSWYNNFDKDDEARVIALLFAACMCDD